MTSTDAAHVCVFDEVEIQPDDFAEDDALKPGMKVLIPCTCGETARDELETLEAHIEDLQRAVLSVEPHRVLYHWSPDARFKQILRYGMRPYMKPVTTSDEWRPGYTCWADDPGWAWQLSGGQPRFDKGSEWDLWMVRMTRLDPKDVHVLPSEHRPSGIYEVRVTARIFKRDVVFVGSRRK